MANVKKFRIEEKDKVTEVEIPSGGSEGYKLINTITTEEEVSSFYCNVDSNGNPFECDDIIITINCNTVIDTQVFYRLGNGNVGEGKEQYYYHIAVNASNVKYFNRGLMCLEKIDANVYKLHTMSAVNLESSSTDSSVSFGYAEVKNNSYHDIMSDEDKIKEVAIFYTGTTTTIPAGTTFRIYGR